MRQFPVLFEMVAEGSMHLTGILMLAPYLTADNHRGVLVRARYRRKRELELLVAELAPACDVPALVQPLGVATGSRTVPSTGWAALTESTLRWVRQLESGDGRARREARATQVWNAGAGQCNPGRSVQRPRARARRASADKSISFAAYPCGDSSGGLGTRSGALYLLRCAWGALSRRLWHRVSS